jgi:hypothetical protein
MKYLYAVILTIFITNNLLPQVELRGGMGISLASTPVLTDYLNQNYFFADEKLNDFNTAANFSLEAGYFVNPGFQIALEAAYLLSSFTTLSSLGKYEFAYGNFMPSLLAYHVIAGEGYFFKLGGGAGIRLLNVEETRPPNVSGVSYSALGFGILLRADGNTRLGGNLFANIGADLRYDFNGEPESGGINIFNNIQNENVNLNSFSFVLRLGVSYLF